MLKIERNDLCPCESKKKYKKCCLLEIEREISLIKEQQPTDNNFVNLDPYDIHKLCNTISKELEETNDLKIARQKANSLYYMYPNDDSVYFLQGICYLKEDKFVHAIYHFEQAIQLCPEFSEAIYNLGIIYFNKGFIIPAYQAFNKSIQIENKRTENKNTEIIKDSEKAMEVIYDFITKDRFQTEDALSETQEPVNDQYLNKPPTEQSIS